MTKVPMTTEVQSGLSKEEIKQVLIEGLKEWLSEEKHKTEATVGRWVMRFVLSGTVVALTYFMLQMNGWKRLP